MSEWQLFDPEAIPEWTTPEWYAGREAAPHLEQEGHRDRLLLSAEFVLRAIDLLEESSNGAADVIDLGAGDGGLLQLVQEGGRHLAVFGYDLQETNVEAASKRGVIVEYEDVVKNLNSICTHDITDVFVTTEMLEHLVDPHGFVRRLSQSPAKYLVASSPYTETDQSHYEFHTWAWDLDGYRALLEDNGWYVIDQKTAWISQVLLAERA